MTSLRAQRHRARGLAARFASRLTHVESLANSSRSGILITGSGGRIGRILRAGLDGEYTIRGLDVEPGPGVDFVANMRSLGRIERAFVGANAVIDLAAVPNVNAPWRVVRENNLPATLNALEAARRAGVARYVYASSNHVTGMYEHDEPYASIVAGRYEGLDPESLSRFGAEVAIRPDSFYAVGKAAGEAAARFYSETYGLSVICLRIGQVNLDDRPKQPAHYATLLTHRDLVQLVRCCLGAPSSLRFAIYYGVSANTWRFWDLDSASTEIGYRPAGNAEFFRS